MRRCVSRLNSHARFMWVVARWWLEDLAAIALPVFVLVGVVALSWKFWTWILGL